jgi:glycerol-3-phosphate responsive antiterminator
MNVFIFDRFAYNMKISTITIANISVFEALGGL